jgi:hypothetical protein
MLIYASVISFTYLICISQQNFHFIYVVVPEKEVYLDFATEIAESVDSPESETTSLTVAEDAAALHYSHLQHSVMSEPGVSTDVQWQAWSHLEETVAGFAVEWLEVQLARISPDFRPQESGQLSGYQCSLVVGVLPEALAPFEGAIVSAAAASFGG